MVRVPRVYLDADARRQDRDARAVAVPRRAILLVATGVPPRSDITPGGGRRGEDDDGSSQGGWRYASAVADLARAEAPPPIAGDDALATDAAVSRIPPRRRGPALDDGARSGRCAPGGGGDLPVMPAPAPPGRMLSSGGRRNRDGRRR